MNCDKAYEITKRINGREKIIEIASSIKRHTILVGGRALGARLVAQVVAGRLPLPKKALAMEQIYHVMGIEAPRDSELHLIPPFREPKHFTSVRGWFGAMPDEYNAYPQYGEVTLADQGVLYVEQIEEVEKTILEELIGAMHTGNVHHALPGRFVLYPANFLLIAQLTPCFCGMERCECDRRERENYEQKIAPLLKRYDVIDLRKELA